MTPKEKAKDLVKKMALKSAIFKINEYSIKCALICVDEIIQAEMNLTSELLDNNKSETSLNYWNEVKSEIDKLQQWRTN